MELIKCSTNYALALSTDDMLYIVRQENKGNYCLMDNLMEINGIDSLEWDGLFGPYIYYTADDDMDTPELHAKVRDTIINFLKGD